MSDQNIEQKLTGIGIFAESKIAIARLQLNYWIHKGESEAHLDFGIEIEGATNSEFHLSIYLPFVIEKENVKCLSDYMKESLVSSAIFNAACTVKAESDNPNSFVVSCDGVDREVMKLYINNLIFEKYNEGMLLKFVVPGRSVGVVRYLRLRVTSKSIAKAIAKETRPLGSLFQSALTKNREIDFRVNSPRSLPEGLCEHEKKSFAKPKVAHFFLLTDSSETIVSHNKDVHSNRFLELNSWGAYIPGGVRDKKQNIFAYHWKYENDIKEVALFVRTNFASTSKCQLLIYLIITVFLCFSVNMCSSMTYDYGKHKVITKYFSSDSSADFNMYDKSKGRE
jgi:hypothetical protein